MSEKEKVYWLIGSEENKSYGTTTWYRCMGIENFIKKVEADNKKIVGVLFSENNLGFILEDSPSLPA